MREDTKDLIAVTALLFFAAVLILFMLFTVAKFFLIIVAVLGSIGLLSWSLIRFSGMDK